VIGLWYMDSGCFNWCSVFRSVYISVKDVESGLRSITTSIYDKTLKVTVWSETQPALTLQPAADSKRKRVSSVLLAKPTKRICWVHISFNFTIDKYACRSRGVATGRLKIMGLPWATDVGGALRGKYVNTASLTTITLQYRQSVKRVFAFLIDNTLQTASPFINAAVNQSAVAVRATPAGQHDRLLQLINRV